MKWTGTTGKEYRILAIAIIFFLVGIFFFYQDNYGNRSEPKASVPAKNFQVAGESPTLDPLFAKFPAPSKFNQFTYDGEKLNEQNSLSIATPCNDAYIAILIFPTGFDYREDVSRALYDKVFVCKNGQEFNYAFAKKDIPNLESGAYYMIVADQGTSGAWYNAR